MRNEACRAEAVPLYLTIPRKSPTADTMRLAVGVTRLSTIRLRVCFLPPIANETDEAGAYGRGQAGSFLLCQGLQFSQLVKVVGEAEVWLAAFLAKSVDPRSR